MAKRGLFVLFEGVDRCGKTTQAKLLVDKLNALGEKAVFMRFPDRDTAIGAQLNAYLARAAELDDHAVHLLFAANRWEKKADILSTLRAGTHVVMDRYAFSGVAFSSAKPALSLEWCKHPDAGLPLPDLVLFMDLSVEQASARGGFGGERYENAEFQSKVRENFSVLKKQTDELSPHLWRNVDAAGTIEEVHGRIAPLVGSAAARVLGHARVGSGGLNGWLSGYVGVAVAGAEAASSGPEPIRRLWDGAVLVDDE